MSESLASFVLVLQIGIVAFLGLHDWIPLGSLNDVRAARAENPDGRLLRTTLISVAPFVVGLAGSIATFGRPYPTWLVWWLWITYGALAYGAIRAWWIPYFVRPDPVRAARFAAMFGSTAAFLPERNGIRPNTLHVVFHAAVLALLIALAVLTLR